MSSCLFPISMMDADYNKHPAVFSPFLLTPNILPPFLPFVQVFYARALMTTACFDMSVAMEEHLNDYHCSHTILLIN